MSQSTPLIIQSRRRPRRKKALGMGGRAFAFSSQAGSGDTGFTLPDLPSGQFFLVDGAGAYLLDGNGDYLTSTG